MANGFINGLKEFFKDLKKEFCEGFKEDFIENKIGRIGLAASFMFLLGVGMNYLHQCYVDYRNGGEANEKDDERKGMIHENGMIPVVSQPCLEPANDGPHSSLNPQKNENPVPAQPIERGQQNPTDDNVSKGPRLVYRMVADLESVTTK